MDLFTDEEIRVLGCLMEKAVTTPDQYPLTLNSLLLACNQKTSREPVVEYCDEDVELALDGLRARNIAWQATSSGARVPKYKHSVQDKIPLSDAEFAVLCVLMLRGPQTVGEIRGRTGRLYEFDSLDAVAEVLISLANRDDALVTELPRQAGRKDNRWAHLLAGEPVVAETMAAGDDRPEPSRGRVSITEQRVEALAAEVGQLRAELADIRAAFDVFRRQFD